jgi:tetratricopeptide (TPR) repeat protein
LFFSWSALMFRSSLSTRIRFGITLLCATAAVCPAAEDDPRQTLAKLNAAIRKDPTRADAYLFRGLIRQQLGEPEQALDDFETAIQIDPQNADAVAHRGILRQEQGKLDEAHADFSAAIRLDPRDASNYLLRGHVRYALGKADLAINDWSDVIRLEPNHAEAYMHRALARGMKEEFAAALQDCDRALRINPRLRPVWQLQGWIRATCPDRRFRDGALAISAAKRACELSNWEDSLAIETLAAAYAEQRDFTTALRWQRQAIAKLAPNTPALADARMRQSLYESHQPFRDERPEPAAASTAKKPGSSRK